MRIYQYPQNLDIPGFSVLAKLIKDLKTKKHIIELLKKYLTRLSKLDIDNLEIEYRSGRLKRIGFGISEIRIPTDHIREGVSRVYFIIHPEITNAILILHAEYKRNDKDKNGVSTAIKIKKEAINRYEQRKKDVDSLGIAPIDDIEEFFHNLSKDDPEHQKFNNEWDSLSPFILDFEYLKGINNLTQKEIAKRMSTTQSAISRVVNMKCKPSYDILRKMSEAVGGNLFITPLGQYSITLPNDLHEKAKIISNHLNLKISDYLDHVLRNEIESTYKNLINIPANDSVGEG